MRRKAADFSVIGQYSYKKHCYRSAAISTHYFSHRRLTTEESVVHFGAFCAVIEQGTILFPGHFAGHERTLGVDCGNMITTKSLWFDRGQTSSIDIEY